MQTKPPRSSWLSSVLLGAAFGHLVAFPDYAHSATLGIGQDYDENVFATNAVDASAPGNALSLTQFKTDVSAAFSANIGGVINFNLPNGSTANDQGNFASEPITVSYGLGKSFNITSSTSYDIHQFASLSAISGASADALTHKGMASAVAFTPNWALNFGNITGGSPGEAITTAGFVLLSRNGFGQSVTVNWFTDNHVTPYAVQTDSILTGAGTDDTFFSFTAPAGNYVTGFEILFNGATGDNDRRYGIDDLGFITSAVPEPSGALLLGLGASCLGLRRRRRG